MNLGCLVTEEERTVIIARILMEPKTALASVIYETSFARFKIATRNGVEHT